MPFLTRAGMQEGRDHRIAKRQCGKSGIPLRAELPRPHQTYEPVAKARTIPLTPGAATGRQRTNKTFNCLDVATRTERDYVGTLSEVKPPNGRCCRPWERWLSVRELSLRPGRAGLATAWWNVHPTTRSRPVSEREGHKRSFKNATNSLPTCPARKGGQFQFQPFSTGPSSFTGS